jgi:hypothetical protein
VTAPAGQEPVALAEILARAVAAGLATQDELDALDRGVVEAGQMAAEALAAVRTMERRVAALGHWLQVIACEARAPAAAMALQREQAAAHQAAREERRRRIEAAALEVVRPS